MSIDNKPSQDQKQEHHRDDVLEDILDLTHILLKDADPNTLESFRMNLDRQVCREELSKKADKSHEHELKDLPGRRSGETLLQSLQSIVSLLSDKASKTHHHSLSDFLSNNELQCFIKSLIHPVFTFSMIAQDDSIVLTAELVSARGYAMDGIYIEYRKRSSNTNEWVLLDTLYYKYNQNRYPLVCKDLDQKEFYEFEIIIKDSLTPEFEVSSRTMTVCPKVSQSSIDCSRK